MFRFVFSVVDAVAVAALEFDEMIVDSDVDFYDKIEKFIVIGEDGNYIHE